MLQNRHFLPVICGVLLSYPFSAAFAEDEFPATLSLVSPQIYNDAPVDVLSSRLITRVSQQDRGIDQIPSDPADSFRMTSDSCVADCEIPLTRFRRTCFQGAHTNYSYLSDDTDTGIAVRTVEAYGTFAIPLGSMDHVVSLTPYIRADLLESAAAFDVPDTLYDTGVKFCWRRPVNDRFSTLVLVTPSVRSDFTTGDGAFRLFGMGLLNWQWVPDQLTASGGVVYTGREDFPILPAMGLLWTPSPEWRVDVQFPSPKISRRIAKCGGQSETWAYLSGVFGGNTWAVTRTGGATDELTISDLRLVVGIEYVQSQNRGVFGELGYVFDRSFEYKNLPLEQELDSAIMMRFGISF